jgi:hypothetical protein
MNKSELESKHLADLHALAAEAGVPRYRMLARDELIAKLSDGGERNGSPRKAEKPSGGERPPRRGRERSGRDRRPRERGGEREGAKERKPAPKPEEKAPVAEPEPERAAAVEEAETTKPKRKRRRRRFGRRSKGLRPQVLLQPPPGRQALVYGESREACTALLREIAADVAEASIALLVDPSPEELADWKREAPRAELVVAAQTRHASDASAQAVRRAESGEHVTLLVDSLTKLEDAETAQGIFDAGLSLKASGSLTVVAALERSA